MLGASLTSLRVSSTGWSSFERNSDPLSEAEPGNVLHEMRGGEMAALREVPFALYYGSVDATPLFVMLVGLYVEHTGDIETLRELWPNVEAALGWINGPGDPDREMVSANITASTRRVSSNQGWRIPRRYLPRGRSMAQGPIGALRGPARLRSCSQAPGSERRAAPRQACARLML